MFTPRFLSLLLIIGLHEHGDTFGLGQDAESHGGQDLVGDEASEMKVRLPVSRQHMQQLRAALNLQVSGAAGPHPPWRRHETLKKARKIMEKSPSSLFGVDKAPGSHYRNAEDKKGPTPPLDNDEASGSYYRHAEDDKGPTPPLDNDKASGSYYRHAEDNKGPTPPLDNDKAPGSYYRHAEDNKGPTPPLDNDKAPGSYYRHAEDNKGPIVARVNTDSERLDGNSGNRPLLPANAGGPGPRPLKLTLILENKKTETLTDDASDDLEFSIANSKTETLIGLRNPSLPIGGQF
nr:PREDICTED: eukaryotic translation initiation factor 3 subunit A-like [Bemisia tabaci]